MSYATTQTKVLALLQLMDEFDDENSAESDFRVLAHGKAQYAVLLKGATGKPGESGQQDVATEWTYTRRDDYTVEIHIFASFGADQLDTRETVTDLADAVEAHFDKYPKLDGTAGIVDTRIDVVGEPDEWTVGAGGYWRQTINLEVVEMSIVTLEEKNGVLRVAGFLWDGATKWDGTGEWQ